MKPIDIPFGVKNNFVVDNTSAEHFEKDAELYRKTLSTSRLIPELARVNQFNRKELDGRMLMEMLDFVTPEEILKNRGIKSKAEKAAEKAAAEKAAAEKAAAEKAAAEKAAADKDEFTQEKADELLTRDPKALDYADELKPLVKFLNLKTKDRKKVTLIAALEAFKNTAPEEPPAEEPPTENPPAEDHSATDPTAENLPTENPTAEEKTDIPDNQESPPPGSQEPLPGDQVVDKKKEEQE